MIDTNALLSVAFSLIANFTNVVPVPSDAVPQYPADLAKCVVGSPSSPTDLYLVHKRGTEFWINGGVVYRFRSPGSFFELQDAKSIANYTGTSILESNDVVRVAATALQRLIKSKDPLLNGTNGAPKIQYASYCQGARIPFYKVIWPRIRYGPERGADVEIDGRTGRIVFLHLWDMAFRDPMHAQKLSKLVYTEAPRPAPAQAVRLVKKFHLPQPTTNYVSDAITNWLAFCRKLGLDPGGQTNLADVNWDRTWLYTNAEISTTVPVCQVRLRNSACFESIGGTVFSHFAPDACYTGFYGERRLADWVPFTGKIVKRQEDLMRELETILVQRLGIPESLLAEFKASTPAKPQEIGDPDSMQIKTIKRSLVGWRDWPLHGGEAVAISDTKEGLSAEFDLESGELKWIAFHDPRFVEILNHGPLKAK